MQFRAIPHSQLKVSSVAVGTWAIGGSHWGDVNDRDSEAAIVRALDLGVNLVDTAPVYGAGHAEEVVGRAIKGRRRQEIILSTKCGLRIDERNRRCLKADSIAFEIGASLKRLGTDVIDILFCHWPDKDTPIEETVQALARERDAGRIRAFGLSNHPPELIERAAAAGPLSCLQEHYSLLSRGIEKSVLPVAAKHGLAVLAYAPLGGGILTGKYRTPPSFAGRDVRDFFYPFYKEPLWSRTQELLAVMRAVAERRNASVGQVAIAWAAARPAVASALVGAKNPSQAADNTVGGGLALSADDLRDLTAASDKALAQ